MEKYYRFVTSAISGFTCTYVTCSVGIFDHFMPFNMNELSWEELRAKIGVKEANEELDQRVQNIYNLLKQLEAVLSEKTLHRRLCAEKDWLSAIDQYERSILHLAAKDGHVKLAKALVHSGAHINVKDGIGQTPLTLALHYSQFVIAAFLIENGASVHDIDYPTTPSPREISSTLKLEDMLQLIENKVLEEDAILNDLCAQLSMPFPTGEINNINDSSPEKINLARVLNINVGDQKKHGQYTRMYKSLSRCLFVSYTGWRGLP